MTPERLAEMERFLDEHDKEFGADYPLNVVPKSGYLFTRDVRDLVTEYRRYRQMDMDEEDGGPDWDSPWEFRQ